MDPCIVNVFSNIINKMQRSSSSSTGNTARWGFWPVEQYPSIFSYLSPTLSIIVTSIQLFPLFDFRNNMFFYCVGLLAPRPTQPGGQGYPFLSGSSPLTCLAALPVAYATASIALGIMLPHKPHHYVKVGMPSGGRCNITQCIYVCEMLYMFQAGPPSIYYIL
jgi:hypothetical protein